MNCFDPGCSDPGKYLIREHRLCQRHYIEALEHSGHIESRRIGWDAPLKVILPIPKSKKELDKQSIL